MAILYLPSNQCNAEFALIKKRKNLILVRMLQRNLDASLLELVRRTSTELPADVKRVISQSIQREQDGSIAKNALTIIEKNIQLAKERSLPLCQDTGSCLFYVDCPVGFDQITFAEAARNAVKTATQKGYLRQNSVDSLNGKNSGTNLGLGMPVFHFHQHSSSEISVRMMLKGGGSENMGHQYALPIVKLGANRDLEGCRRVILDAVLDTQGKGCGPGILGICIGGDRATGFEHSKEQLLRKLDDINPIPELAQLEATIIEQANQMGIGPMGFGGKTTLLGAKIGVLNRLPACYFVSISYMCWAFRRQGITLGNEGEIKNWLY